MTTPRKTKVDPTSRQQGAATIPPPPDWLPNQYAVKEWCRLAPILIKRGQLDETTIGVFGQMCALHGRIAAFNHVNETPPSVQQNLYRQYARAFGLWPRKPKPSKRKTTPQPTQEKTP
jgi:hypothetical protein